MEPTHLKESKTIVTTWEWQDLTTCERSYETPIKVNRAENHVSGDWFTFEKFSVFLYINLTCDSIKMNYSDVKYYFAMHKIQKVS